MLLVKRSRFFMTRRKKGREDEVVELRAYSETADDPDSQNERKAAPARLGPALTTVTNATRARSPLSGSGPVRRHPDQVGVVRVVSGAAGQGCQRPDRPELGHRLQGRGDQRLFGLHHVAGK